MLSEELALDSVEIEATYQLFLSTWQQGKTLLANPDEYNPEPSTYLGNCLGSLDRENNNEALLPEDRIERDYNYVIRSWIAVLTYLLSDYRYIYE